MPITPLPDPPLRSAPATFTAKADAFLGALPAFATEANALAEEVDEKEAAAIAAASTAEDAAAASLAAANFKGAWGDQTGAAAVPYAVSHLGRYWQLLDDLADVTAKTPGTDPEWQEIQPFATAAEILAGTETAKAIAPDQLAAAGIVPPAFASAAEILAGVETEKQIAPDQAVLALMKKDGSNIAIGSDADGDLYFRAAGVLTRLAKGAGNLKLFMNAAGDAPEWASGLSRTSHSYDVSTASGTQTLTGAGFTPSRAHIVWAIGGQTHGEGWSIKGTNFMQLRLYGSTVQSGSIYDSKVIWGATDTGFVNNFYASLAFNSDGGVLTWVKTGSPTGTLQIYVVWEK
jgi:hypothetical protein